MFSLPPVVCIAGWGFESESFTPLMDSLKTEPVLKTSVDQIVAEFSTTSTIAWDSLRAALEEKLNHFSEPVCLVGWSMGAALAIDYAARYPERCSQLIVISGFAKFCSEPEDYLCGLNPQNLRALHQQIRRGNKAAFQKFVTDAFGANTEEESVIRSHSEFDVSRYASMMDAIGVPERLSQQLQVLGNIDLRQILSKMSVPVLIIHGSADTIVPCPASEYLSEHIPGSRLRVFENQSHALLIQKPVLVASAIMEFLKSDQATEVESSRENDV